MVNYLLHAAYERRYFIGSYKGAHWSFSRCRFCFAKLTERQLNVVSFRLIRHVKAAWFIKRSRKHKVPGQDLNERKQENIKLEQLKLDLTAILETELNFTSTNTTKLFRFTLYMERINILEKNGAQL
jgi:hypothetical protein